MLEGQRTELAFGELDTGGGMKLTFPRLDARQTLAAGLGLAVVALFLSIRIVLVPIISGIASRRASIQELERLLTEARELQDQREAQERLLAQARSEYQVLQRRVGTGQSIARVLEALSQQAREQRLEITSLKPEMDGDDNAITELGPSVRLRKVPLSLSVAGHYRQVGDFLGQLAQGPFLASIETLRISKPSNATAKVQAELALSVYLAEQVPAP